MQLFLIGLILIVGMLGGRLFERLGIPHVVGYITAGILLGDSVSHIIPLTFLDRLSPITSIALAFIGFMVGGEMKYTVFKKFGKQLLVILLSEGLLAMVLVTTLTFLWTGNAALALLLGALSSATAPAATVDVLWEYQSRGPLTTTILALVALDDGLALMLYGFACAFATVFVAGTPLNTGMIFAQPLMHIVGSLALGVCIGGLLDQGVRLAVTKEERLVINVGAILFTSGMAIHWNLSLILTNMMVGLFITNTHPERNEANFDIIKSFAPPIYILFFIFVGARLQFDLLPKMGVLGLLYVLGRTAGKWTGAYLGARISRAPRSVRNYLGYALFSQAGVALGLALDIYQRFSGLGAQGKALGFTVINVIAATTIIVQIIGPPCVKYAIAKAEEMPLKNGVQV